MKILLKQHTIRLLIFVVFAMNFSSAFVWVGSKLNQDYITKTLCVNRFKPSLHCNGKCYFMRKIKEVEQKEKSAESQLQKYKFQEAIFNANNDLRFYSRVLLVIKPSAQNPVLPLITIPIFQPPPLG